MINLTKQIEALGTLLKKNHLKLTCAESCTGGGLASLLTHISGSSAWFERGFVTYSNKAKHEMLGVSEKTLQTKGAVSEATVCEMAEGAIQHSDAHLSVSISGIAGPTGGTPTKPVGTVWIGIAGLGQPTAAFHYQFDGNRDTVRDKAMHEALKHLSERANAYHTPPTNSPRYFFALWPDEATKNQLSEHQHTLSAHGDGTPSRPKNLHLTLAYLGPLHEQTLKTLSRFSCSLAPFELSLNELRHCSKSQIAYAAPKSNTSLTALHACLTKHLLTQGIKPERRVFAPHVTLTRNHQHAFHATSINPIHWFVHDVCLARAIPGKNPSDYEIIERTPLTLKTC